LVLPFWYRLTQVVLEKRPLNGCCYFNGTVCGNTTTIQNTGLTDQLQPRNDAVAVIDVFTRQATNMLVELEIFHADVALQT